MLADCGIQALPPFPIYYMLAKNMPQCLYRGSNYSRTPCSTSDKVQCVIHNELNNDRAYGRKGPLPGKYKVPRHAGGALKPKALVGLGTGKSFVLLFIINPVSSTIRSEPKLLLIVLVSDAAIPRASIIQ